MRYRALITEQYYVEFEAPEGLPQLYLTNIAENPMAWIAEPENKTRTASEIMEEAEE